MGIGVSGWRLAGAVAKHGQMGVVSGTAIDAVVARRLQLGDPGGDIRRALSHFPWPAMAQRVLDAFFIPGGKPSEKPFRLIPRPTVNMRRFVTEMLIAANFVEIFLAGEGHNGAVGVNYLEKVQLPTLPSLFGAMLAGVDVVLMGAGIPLSIPGIIDRLAEWQPVELKLHVENNPDHLHFSHRFDPRAWCEGGTFPLKRPRFLAIVSSDIVAKTMIRKATGTVDGFVVEDHTAGGHNAPPRKAPQPVEGAVSPYGPKDAPNLERIMALGKPFWLAGGYNCPSKLKAALAAGANGIQVGTVFAYCTESGIMPAIRRAVIDTLMTGGLETLTDFQASPTGYPFKLIDLNSGLSSIGGAKTRRRVCDLGYLQQFVHAGDSDIMYRCPGEPVEKYLKKGGSADDAEGKMCLCNGLLATIGLGQVRGTDREIPILTAGEDFSAVKTLVRLLKREYSAADVIDYILSRQDGTRPSLVRPLLKKVVACGVPVNAPCDAVMDAEECVSAEDAAVLRIPA